MAAKEAGKGSVSERKKSHRAGLALASIAALGTGALVAGVMATSSVPGEQAHAAEPGVVSGPGSLDGVPGTVTPGAGGDGAAFGSEQALPQSGGTARGVGDGQGLANDNADAMPYVPDAKPMKPARLARILQDSLPKGHIGHAVAVARGESGLNPSSVGERNSDGTRDWGLFQLNDGGTLQGALTAIGHKPKSLLHARTMALDPNLNIKAAVWLFKQRGWAPWVAAYKVGIVAKLYSNEHGPMWGKFDLLGKPDPKKMAEPKPKPKPKPVAKPKPKPVKPKPVVPSTPAPTPTASATPSQSASSAQ